MKEKSEKEVGLGVRFSVIHPEMVTVLEDPPDLPKFGLALDWNKLTGPHKFTPRSSFHVQLKFGTPNLGFSLRNIREKSRQLFVDGGSVLVQACSRELPI